MSISSYPLYTQPLVPLEVLHKQWNKLSRKAVQSILGATQSRTVHMPEQPAVADSVMDWRMPRCSLPLQQFHDQIRMDFCEVI